MSTQGILTGKLNTKYKIPEQLKKQLIECNHELYQCRPSLFEEGLVLFEQEDLECTCTEVLH